MAYLPAPVSAPARTEQVSTTLVLNPALVARTLRAAASAAPRQVLYANPDGSLASSRAEAAAFDRESYCS